VDLGLGDGTAGEERSGQLMHRPQGIGVQPHDPAQKRMRRRPCPAAVRIRYKSDKASRLSRCQLEHVEAGLLRILNGALGMKL
jgi:hypothetical protein